jgi:hypothetical protein
MHLKHPRKKQVECKVGFMLEQQICFSPILKKIVLQTKLLKAF